MKSKSTVVAGLWLLAGVVLAADPEIPVPILSKPDSAVPSNAAPAAAGAAVATNQGAVATSLTNQVPASMDKPSRKDPVAAELERMHAELDKMEGPRWWGSPDFSASLQLLYPEDAFWPDADGYELRWRHWLNSFFGFSVTGGSQSWTLREGQYVVDPSHMVHPQLQGSAEIIPLGISAVFRRPLGSDAFRISAEVGIRYLMVSSDVTMSITYPNMFNQETFLETSVGYDNRTVGMASLEVGGAVGRHFEWFLSGGYQMDSGGDENWLFETIGNDFSGAIVGAGLRWIP
jgi:hypothetical protein